MSDNLVYLDYNATAPLRTEVATLIEDLQRGAPLNASSVHAPGRQARKLIEKARNQVAALAGVPNEQVTFNSGATEANNTVLQYFAKEDGPDKIAVSAIEHPSVLDVIPAAVKIPVTPDGLIDMTALEDILTSENKPSLVSVMLVNNETGVIQPIQEISALVHKHGALLHCDGVQAAGRIPIDMGAMGIDFLSLSAHKIGGPQGVGALVLGFCGITPAWLQGGGQEKKARAGTENTAGIAGFGLAAELAAKGLDAYNTDLSKLRDHLESTLGSNVIIHSHEIPRVANTTLFSLPGARSESLLMSFDLEGIALSNGSACTSGSVQPSHVLEAMNCPAEQARSALRVSMGWNTTLADIDRFLEVWSKVSQRILKKRSQ